MKTNKGTAFRVKKASCFLALLLAIAPLSASIKREINKIDDSKAFTATSLTTFGPSVFLPESFFFLGANTTGQNTAAFSRVLIETDKCDKTKERGISFLALAPQDACVNNKKSSKNPVYTADIKDITLKSQVPVVLLGTPNPDSKSSEFGDNQTIALINDVNKGSVVYTTTQKLNDANGDASSGILGIGASRNYIFAGVAPEGGTFGNANSGIAMLKVESCSLKPIDPATGENENKSLDFSTIAGSDIAIQEHITMHWDNTLKRLFVGLHVKDDGGNPYANSLLVGRIEGTTGENPKPRLVLEPAIPTGLATGNDKIVGFDDNTILDTREAIVHHVKTMHTSTGKGYVIVNGKVYNSGVDKNEVFALPIVKQIYCDNTPTSSHIGRVANNDNADQDTITDDENKIATEDDEAAIIGGGDAPADVEEMYVLGDTVYICCIGEQNGSPDTNPNERGIFKSTALFDENGLIRSWTPWERTMGAVDYVYGMGIDTTAGRFWYLTQTTAPGDTAKVTSWTYQDDNLLGLLQTELATEFPFCDGGVHQMFNFSDQTLGFDRDEFSMMVATGYQKVAIIQSGKDDANDKLLPTSGDDFGSNLATYFQVHNNQALKDIGPICAADISRTDNGDWLFVGGYGGLAVLSDVGAADGEGWDDLNDITNIASFTFKKIGDFSRVHKIICAGDFLYVMTQKALYRIELNEDKFKENSPDPLNEVIIADTSYANLNLTSHDSLLDFIVSGKTGILATTNGLYRTSNDNDVMGTTAQAREWTEVKNASGNSLGPVTHLFPLAVKSDNYDGAFNNGGNLYIVAGDMSLELATVVRFDIADTLGQASISDTTITPIAEKIDGTNCPVRDYYYPFGEFRSAFATNGTFGFHTLSKHVGKTNQARFFGMTPSVPSARARDKEIPLDLSDSSYNIGIPVKNTTSGAWMIPGDWGVRIHE